MFFSADFLNLIFYCAQQLGVTLGVGAETIMLAAYLISMRDGVVDEKEGQYARAIKRVLSVALWLIVASGIGITLLHLMAGEGAIIFTPAYLFKWLLVVLAVALTGLRRAFPVSLVEGVIGGTWYALFLVHILAPATSWFNLGTLYAVWLVGFVICWEVLTLMMRDKKGGIKKTATSQKASVGTSAVAAQKPAIILSPDIPRPLLAPASSPITTMESLPANKVTDTPFLPQVPPLQPIPTTPQPAPAVITPTLMVEVPNHVPVAPVPAPIPAPSVDPAMPLEDGLSPMNLMPKNPAADNAKK